MSAIEFTDKNCIRRKVYSAPDTESVYIPVYNTQYEERFPFKDVAESITAIGQEYLAEIMHSLDDHLDNIFNKALEELD